MKKLVAISVLFAILTVAVFAQDDEGKWKVGVQAQLSRNIFYATKATGETTTTVTNAVGTTTTTEKLGDYLKGSTAFWTFTSANPWDGLIGRHDNRLLVSLSTSGDFYSAYIDFKLDNDWITNNPTFMGLLSGDAADWYFTGSTAQLGGPLVIDGKVGTGRYGGFVQAYEFWDDYLARADYNFFGVQTTGGFIQSDNISTTGIKSGPWDSVYALGLSFGDFRFALGSRLASFNIGPNNPYASASSIEAGFMFSGRGLGPLTFDLFYAINGSDNNTFLRGTGAWNNLLGAYFGLDVVENLGLSIGYTATFVAREKGIVMDGTTEKAVEYSTPIFSGVDIKLKYSGIDKIGITFNNNLSFSGAEGAERTNAWDKVIYGINMNPLGKDQKDGWFTWTSVLGLSYSATDNLSLTLAFWDEMKITTTDRKTEAAGTTTTTKNSRTDNALRVSLHADYNVGNVAFGLGLNLGVAGYSIENKRDQSGTITGSRTEEGKFNEVQFGIPVVFKVSL
jgi:hypothetical protein